MASWFTVYCTRPVRRVATADLAAALRAVDFHTIAEGFGIEDEVAVERAVDALRIEPATGKLGEWFTVRYRPAKDRPLVVHLWTEAARVQQELAEARDEYLADRNGGEVGQISAILSGVVEVAAVGLGLGQLEDMGLVIAGQIAEYLADAGSGLIRDTDDEWWVLRQGVPRLLLGRP